jgi:hypothetical protein
MTAKYLKGYFTKEELEEVIDEFERDDRKKYAIESLQILIKKIEDTSYLDDFVITHACNLESGLRDIIIINMRYEGGK